MLSSGAPRQAAAVSGRCRFRVRRVRLKRSDLPIKRIARPTRPISGRLTSRVFGFRALAVVIAGRIDHVRSGRMSLVVSVAATYQSSRATAQFSHSFRATEDDTVSGAGDRGGKRQREHAAASGDLKAGQAERREEL